MSSDSLAIKISGTIPPLTTRTKKQASARLLFFSGGSALAGFSRTLKKHTQNSQHLITTFDSGGCSAQLRKFFKMPAVGDIRNRLLALADNKQPAVSHLIHILGLRFAKQGSPDCLKQTLLSLTDLENPLYASVGLDSSKTIIFYLNYFAQHMPADFDLRNSSVGNLCLAAAYLHHNRNLQAVIDEFSRLLALQGKVYPVINGYYDLTAELIDGRVVSGQHKLTGKEVSPLTCKIKSVYLTAPENHHLPVEICAEKEVLDSIKHAELICYPPGSFYSSVIANLLPKGIGHTISKNPCHKVYIPNLAKDPEQLDMSLLDCVQTILKYLKKDAPNASNINLLSWVLMDENQYSLADKQDIDAIIELGINIKTSVLISQRSAPYYDPTLLSECLTSLAQ
ncbi:GAK system CofD-like protein [Catenovulum sediminis]|uniref:GAK system CofD-like protein n=1 Tax=Catenovulum sediminis TaxID=1740262 RepID=UPI003314C2B2